MKRILIVFIVLNVLLLCSYSLRASVQQDNTMFTAAMNLRNADLQIKKGDYKKALGILENVKNQLKPKDQDDESLFLYLNTISSEHSVYIATQDFSKAASLLKMEITGLLDIYKERGDMINLIFMQMMGQLKPYEEQGELKAALAISKIFENTQQLQEPYYTIYKQRVAEWKKSIANGTDKANYNKRISKAQQQVDTTPKDDAALEKEIEQAELESQKLAALLGIQEKMNSGEISSKDINALMDLQASSGELDKETKAEMEQFKTMLGLKQKLEEKGITAADLSGNTEFMKELDQVSGGEMKNQLSPVMDQITSLLGLSDAGQIENLSLSDMNLNLEAIQKMAEDSGLEIPMDSIAYAWNSLKTQDSLLYTKQSRLAKGNLAQMEKGNSIGGTNELLELGNLLNANIKLRKYKEAEINLKEFEVAYSKLKSTEKASLPEGFVPILYWTLHFAQGDYNTALSFAEQALKQSENKEPYLFEITAITHFQLKNFESAKRISNRGILAIKARNNKPNNKELLRLQQFGYYASIAQGAYEDGLKGLESIKLVKNDDDITSLYDLYLTPQFAMAVARDAIGKHQKSEQYMTEYINSVKDKIFEANLMTDERTQDAMEKYISDNIFYFLHERKTKSEKVLGLGYDTALLFKEFQLNNDRVLTENYLVSKDTELKKLYLDFIRVREKSKDLHLDSEVTVSLADYERAYQKILRRKNMSGINQLFDSSKLNFTLVQDALKKNEAAVEFVSYSPYIFDENSEAVYYGAFILRKNMVSPEFIPLCQATEVRKILNTSDTNENTASVVNTIYGKQAKTLFDKVWQPLTKYLENIDKIYYAPSGLLHNLSFDAILDAQNSYLSNTYELVRMGSTKNIIAINEIDLTHTFENAVLMGGMDYNTPLQATEEQVATSERSGVFKTLPGTIEEINDLNALLEENGIGVLIESGKEATEERFYEMALSRPDIVHIATHAFYVKSVEEDLFSVSENMGYGEIKENQDPMNRSGMTFAGVNQFWKTGNRPLANTEDGILTANEIASLDLADVKLITLSACETAIGNTVDNEGVFGLQRGLKIAGAKNLLVSLWKVDDAVTKEYMTTFYHYLIADKLSMQKAYMKTRNAIKAMHPEPYYWASFVLIR